MIDKTLLTEMIEATPTDADNTEEYYYWQGKKYMLIRIRAYWLCDTETLQSLLLEVTLQHGKAVTGVGKAYWQGQKDAVRTVLAITLNDDSYLDQVKSSLFNYQRAKSNFEFTTEDTKTLLADGRCIECGQRFFHKLGCQHGAGVVIIDDLVLGEMPTEEMSDDEFRELREYIIKRVSEAGIMRWRAW